MVNSKKEAKEKEKNITRKNSVASIVSKKSNSSSSSSTASANESFDNNKDDEMKENTLNDQIRGKSHTISDNRHKFCHQNRRFAIKEVFKN